MFLVIFHAKLRVSMVVRRRRGDLGLFGGVYKFWREYLETGAMMARGRLVKSATTMILSVKKSKLLYIKFKTCEYEGLVILG